jgi:quercetin dioxygenase-like cupin family protein
VAFGLLLCGVAAGAAADSPPATHPSEDYSGTLPGPAVAKQDGISLRTRGDVTVRTFTLTYDPRADSGWHKHPGIVIAVVRSGSVERQVGCHVETFSAGDSFTEVAPHDVKNVGSVPAVLSITQIFPIGATAREPADPPRCPPHHHR